ncbi:MAG TPA: ABC transporter permease subunit [Methylomirabilota bacterium]|nr:ABC transporter permease subunit [Methylomirabilota bacterium]
MRTRHLLLITILILAVAAGYYHYAKSTQRPARMLVVGTNTPFPPFEYVANGTVTGFDIDAINAIAIKAGYDGITVNDMPFDSLILALQEGQIDVIASGMTITPARQQQVDFTLPYWEADQTILVRKGGGFNPQDMTDLAGKTIGVQTGTTGAYLAEEDNASLGPIKDHDTFLYAVLDLVNGRVDAVLVDSPVAPAFTSQYPVVASATIRTGEQYGFAVRKGNTVLLNALNSALQKFKGSPDWDVLLTKYFSNDQQSMNQNQQGLDPLQYVPYLLTGFYYTAMLTAGGLLLGCGIGISLAFAETCLPKAIRDLSAAVDQVLRGIPLIVMFFLLYFSLPQVGITLAPGLAAAIGLGLRSGGYQSQIFRSTIESIGTEQTEAALSIGMNTFEAYRHVLLPQALRLSIPAWSNEFTIVLKDTSLAYALGVTELLKEAANIVALTLQPLGVYLIVAAIYFVASTGINRTMNMLYVRWKIPGLGGGT